MKVINVVIAWIDYFTDWILYGTKCTKAITGSLVHLRDSWPSKPTIPKPNQEKEKPAVSDIQHPVGAGDQPADNKVLDGSVST